jgi:hypothetical protein
VTPGADGKVVVEVGPDQTRETRVLLATRGAAEKKGQTPVVFTATDADTGATLDVKDVFVWP